MKDYCHETKTFKPLNSADCWMLRFQASRIISRSNYLYPTVIANNLLVDATLKINTK